MVKKEIIVTNKSGLHMRPAHRVIKEAKTYQSAITILKKNDGKSANLKSLVSLLKISINRNTEVEITCDGPDEKSALEAIVKCILELHE